MFFLGIFENFKFSISPISATMVAPPPEQVNAAHSLPLGIPEMHINFKVSIISEGVSTVMIPSFLKNEL